MSRDYAKRKISRKKPKKKRLSRWLIFLLAIGLAVSFFVFNKHYRPSQLLNEFKTKPTKILKQQSAPKVITKIAVTPKFDFYNISPQKKDNNTKKDVKDSYELEIAIANDFAAADRLKAELALLGFAASITPIYHQGTQKYNVSIGPYDNQDIANAVLHKLKLNKVSGILKKSPKVMSN
ncbi:MAG: SPOR domain-containing protein [Gammaproteobacteria bacterium]|nr:SPOR domain-containing protein [Gammaproteobacteria bacterium]